MDKNIALSKLTGKRLIYFMLSFMTLGCAYDGVNISDKCTISKSELYSRIDLLKVTQHIAADLCDPSLQMLTAYRTEDVILVPDMLDIQTYKPEKIGVHLGDLLRASVNSICRYPVRQLDLSEQIKLNEDGLTALTREAVKAAQTSVPAHTAILVTYSVQPNKLTLVGRTVHLSTSTIVKSSTKEIVWGCKKNFFGDVLMKVQLD